MSVPDFESLQESLNARIDELEDEQERQEKRHQGDGSDSAVWKKAEPKIRRDVVKDCVSDLEEVDDLQGFLRVLAEWRRRENREWAFKRNNLPKDNERNSIKRAEIRGWKDELVELIPESEFKTCGRCGVLKMPKSDRRRSHGYVWECPEC